MSADSERDRSGVRESGAPVSDSAGVVFGFGLCWSGSRWARARYSVFGRPVEFRLVPLMVIGGLALRTVLARQAEQIRRVGS